MLKNIKEVLFKEVNPEDKKGLFLSVCNQKKQLMDSQWVLHTDMPFREVVDTVYTTVSAKKERSIYYVICDIVDDVINVTNDPKVLDLSVKEFGFATIDTEDELSGVILPDTAWVSDVKSALYSLKQKYGIHGKIEIFAFRTIRIVIPK